MMAVELIRWTWTLVAGLGVIFCIWALADSYLDRHALRSLPDYVPGGVREQVVNVNLRSANAGMVLHTFFFALGIFSLMSATRSDDASVVIGAGFILAAAMNVRAIGLNQFDRIRLRRAQPM